MPESLRGLKPDISASAASDYTAGVNFKTGKPISQPDRDHAPLALRLLKAKDLLTTLNFNVFLWNPDFDTTSLVLVDDAHSYSSMKRWETANLSALDGAGAMNLAQTFVDHHWGYPLGSTGAAFQHPQESSAASASGTSTAAARITGKTADETSDATGC